MPARRGAKPVPEYDALEQRHLAPRKLLHPLLKVAPVSPDIPLRRN
jgi:hypothetical protein